MWGGEINLTDLQVKPSALDFLHLPVGVRSGFLGRLRIKVNWRSLWSQPVEVGIEDLYVIAGSKDLSSIDEAAEAARALATKLTALRSVEDFKLSDAFQKALHGEAPTAAAKQGIIGRMVRPPTPDARIRSLVSLSCCVLTFFSV